jgi:copper/silver efflux system protein
VTARLIRWCTRHHWVVIGAFMIIASLGELARRRLASDVIPDLSEPNIGVVVDWMGHPAPEVSRYVTTVLTRALSTVPGAADVRGSTMAGMAYLDVTVKSTTVLESVRRDIIARIASSRPSLPPSVRIQVGPIASSTGWILQYALTDPSLVSSSFDLRRLQDDVLRPALLRIPGVVEVASVGGAFREVRIDLDLPELRKRSLAAGDLIADLRAVFASHNGLAPLSPPQLVALPVAAAHGLVGTKLGDVATIRWAKDMPAGIADLNGVAAVGGIVVAKRDADVVAVAEGVKRTLAEQFGSLAGRPGATPALPTPPGQASAQVTVVYDRSELVNRVRHTFLRAIVEEIAVVAVMIFLFLLRLRSALVPLFTLSAVLLLTFGAMWLFEIPATVMSLGGIGIALGMAVDAEIVALEASHRRLESVGRDVPLGTRNSRLIAAAQTFAPAVLTALTTTALAFLPVFAFSGEAGRLLRPLALTKMIVIAAAVVVTVTLGPALRNRFLRGRITPEFAHPLTRGLVRIYRPFVHFALRRPTLTLVTAGIAVLSCLPIVMRLGAEFLPRVDEGDLLYMPTTLPGVPPDEAARQLVLQDQALSRFDELATVFGKVGRADSATDPAPYSMIETTIRLRPRSEWPSVTRRRWYSSWAPDPLKAVLRLLWPDSAARTRAELLAELDKAVRLPGWTAAWTAPARGRMDMMSTGVRTPVGLRIVSPDPERLNTLGVELRSLLEPLPGTKSAVFESLGGETWLSFEGDPEAMRRHHVDPSAVQSLAAFITAGGQVGDIDENGHRSRVRLGVQMSERKQGSAATQPDILDLTGRGLPDLLRGVTISSTLGPAGDGAVTTGSESSAAGAGQLVPLALVGRPMFVRYPAELRADKGELCAYLYVDLQDGTDVEGYVENGRRRLDAASLSKEFVLAPGERLDWIGQYQLLDRGRKRLYWIAPLVMLSMLGLLLLQFRNATEAALVLAAVPFALIGSVWTLYILGYPMSAPVWTGLLSVIGLATQTGVVMVVYIDAAFYRRVREDRIHTPADIIDAHAEGTILRLRPKVMTVATMAAGLLPLLWTEGAGAEIMKRVAAPMIGGLVTSAILTLEVLPVLYTIWRTRQLRKAQRLGTSIAFVVGSAPPWARH